MLVCRRITGCLRRTCRGKGKVWHRSGERSLLQRYNPGVNFNKGQGIVFVRTRATGSKRAPREDSGRKGVVVILVPVSLAIIILCSLMLLTWIRCKHRWTKLSVEKTTLPFGIDRVTNLRESEKAFMSPLYPLYSIIQATNNFSDVNKLGEGGFGPVYKAWELWKEAKLLELFDPSLAENCPHHEISRCIHIALMCVQENAIDRPNMSTVIDMLSSDSAIADPKQPAFFNVRNPVEEELHSVNEATITSINGR